MNRYRRLVGIPMCVPAAWNSGSNPVHVEDPAYIEGEMDSCFHGREVPSWILDIC